MISQKLHHTGMPVRLLLLAALIGTIIMAATMSATSIADSKSVSDDVSTGNVPGNSVDLRPIFKNWGLTVRPQGSRNTCSIFTVTDALEYAAATQRHEGTRFSVEFLNWAKNQACGKDTDGGFFNETWDGFSRYGICTESNMPYHASFEEGVKPSNEALGEAKSISKLGLHLHWIKKWDPNKGVNDEQLLQIKETLRKQWPVCAGNLWPKKNEWKDGVLQIAPREGMRDGHSVLIVGFKDDPTQPGGGVFIFRNTSRAEKDGLMTYEYAKTYMNDAVWIDYDTGGAGVAPATRPTGVGAAARAVSNLLGPFGTSPVGRNHRVSSNEQPNWNDANMDMTWLQPGEKLEMPLLTGPGVITHMWFTSHSGWVSELHSLSLRIYYDDQTEPGVEVPLADFFCVGHGKPAPIDSFPVQVSPTGALSCYWRMPFKKNARIVITNDNPDRSTGLYWQVDWTQVDHVPDEAPYFCACYRQEYPAQMKRDYMYADLSGSGQYIGTVMSVTLAQDGWFGEGDDFFYIDGEEVPSLQGTGSEDYFNDAWGFRPRTATWFGSPRWPSDELAGDSGVCYRWHVLDAVNFSKSLKVTIEHKGNFPTDADGFFVERPDFVSSVAFWYQNGAPKLFAKLPGWKERRVPWEDHQIVRLFQQIKTTGEAKLRIDTAGLFGARPMINWPNKTADQTLSLPLELAEGGDRIAVRLSCGRGAQFGVYDVELDGKKIATADFHSKDEDAELNLGVHSIEKGPHTVTFRAKGEHIGPMSIEMLRFLKLPPVAQREIKTHHEAHFVRLAIGRAVYCYKLAFNKLPENLQTLVDAGLMSARYLNDENNEPLKSKLENGEFIVESTHNEKWIKHWTGRDARS